MGSSGKLISNKHEETKNVIYQPIRKLKTVVTSW